MQGPRLVTIWFGVFCMITTPGATDSVASQSLKTAPPLMNAWLWTMCAPGCSATLAPSPKLKIPPPHNAWLSFSENPTRNTGDCANVTSAFPSGPKLALKIAPPTLDFARLPPNDVCVATRLAVVSASQALPSCTYPPPPESVSRSLPVVRLNATVDPVHVTGESTSHESLAIPPPAAINDVLWSTVELTRFNPGDIRIGGCFPTTRAAAGSAGSEGTLK